MISSLRRFSASRIAVLVATMAIATFAAAQTITGSLRGAVTDPSGAAVPSASVTVTNQATGVKSTTTSDRNGLYNFQFLPIGNYTVSAAATGFKTTQVGPLTLEIDQIAQINIKLELGSVSTTVNVSAESSAILQTQNSTLGTTVTSNTIENLPLSGLNFQVAGVFVPGAVLPHFDMEGSAQGFERNTNPETAPSFNGNRQQGNNYILDGVEINEPTNNLVGYNPAPEAIQEMRTITANADAEYGDVNGGEFVLITKGGTNQLHGSAYWYYENQYLTANLWSNNDHPVPLPKGVFHQSQYGATLGGPVIRNKLFFFGDYLGTQNISAGMATASVASANMRNCPLTAGVPTCDFSELLPLGTQLYNPNPSPTNPTGGYAHATPYSNDQIPLVNPVAAYLFAHPEIYPMPNRAPDAGTPDRNNYSAPTSGVIRNNQGDVRVDWTLGLKDSLLFRYSDGDAYDLSPKVVLPITFPAKNDYPFHSGVVNWVHTFSPSLVNQARAGISRVQWFNGAPSDPTGKFGLNGDQTVGINAKQAYAGFAQINLSSYETNVGSAGIVQNFLDNIFDYGDDLVWQHGKHITKFGVQVIRYQENYYYAGNYGALGQFIYNGQFTQNTSVSGQKGYGFADFVLDQAASVDVGGVAGPVGQRQYRDSYYAQDDWKVLPNLTLNLGLRYAYDQPWYEVNNKELNVDITKASQCTSANDITNPCLMFAGKNGASRSLYNSYYNEWMPRFGFAWQVDPKTVLRGGYGITNYLEGSGVNLRPTLNPPFFPQFVNAPISPSAASGGIPLSVTNGFTNGGQAPITQYNAWDKNLRPTSVQQFNLTGQYLIDNNTTAQVGYVGELGQRLIVPASPNQYAQAGVPTSAPFYNLVGGGGYVVLTLSEGVENYNALQATLRRHQSGGLEYTFNYTWSRSMTNNPGFFGIAGVNTASAYWQDVTHPKADYGPSGFDVRNTLNGTAVWQLPFGKGRKFGNNWGRLLNETVGGWQLSGDTILHSGFPTNMTGSNNGGFHARTARANQYRILQVKNRSVQHWFGTDPSANPCTGPDNGVCAYGSEQFGQFGNARVNNGPRAAGYRIVDLSLFKSFPTYESQTLTFRADAFNVGNIASYAAPAYVSAANGVPASKFPGNSLEGQITSTLSPARQLQLSLLYRF